MQTTVDFKKGATSWTLTLVAPENKPPTLDYRVMAELGEALDALETAVADHPGTSPACLVIQSSSDRCFCAGANIGILDTLSEETMAEWVAMGHQALNRLEDLPVPVVAKVRGHALGGGLELALACDLIVCDRSAKLGLTEANIGFVPGWGGTFRLPRRVGVARAKRMFYTAEIVEAEPAMSSGLVDAVVESDALDEWLENFANNLASKSAVGVRGFKSILNARDRAAREAHLAIETEKSLECIKNTDTKRRIRDFLEKRKSARK